MLLKYFFPSFSSGPLLYNLLFGHVNLLVISEYLGNDPSGYH